MAQTPRPASRCGIVIAVLAGAVGRAGAHEEYVVEDEHDVGVGEFLAEAATDPAVVVPLLAGALAVFAAVAGYLRVRPAPRDVSAFRAAMGEYTEYVPWLLRISFGIPLIGAGFAGYLISPAVGIDLRLLQVGLGFLLLFGLATRVIAVAGLVVYLVGVALDPRLLLQLEFLGGLAAIVLVGSGRPSADHVLSRLAGWSGTVYGRIDVVYDRIEPFHNRLDPYERYAPTVVRVGLGAAFLYLGASQKLLRPGIALAVVDRYGLAVGPIAPELWVLAAGLTEVTLGLVLIAGAFTRAGAAVAIATFTLTLFALPDDPVLAHVTLFGMASVLLITGGGPYALDNRAERIEGAIPDR